MTEHGPAPEVADLEASYAQAIGADISGLDRVIASLCPFNVAFVASGGALAIAHLAASLHERTTGHAAKVLTPLGLRWLDVRQNPAVCLISASARHPDVADSARVALGRGAPAVVLVTHRERERLPPLLRDTRIRVATLPPTAGKEGFLATTSVIQMSTALVRSYLPEARLPPFLSATGSPTREGMRGRAIILTSPDLEAAAVDLESRLSETGTSSAQVVDYRNFAHGRHYGLSRTLGDTTIIALRTEQWRAIVDRTLAELPTDAHVVSLSSDLEWPLSVIEVLVQSIRLVATQADLLSINLRRPGVSQFGRRLYRLNVSRILDRVSFGPIERKLTAIGDVQSLESLRGQYATALGEWRQSLGHTVFGGVVLDYDGTVVSTEGRYSLPEQEIRAEVIRVLDAGATLAVATGRGDSLYDEFRRWVPTRHRHSVVLALYNGGLVLRLDDAWPIEAKRPSEEFALLVERLTDADIADLNVRSNGWQMSVSFASSRPRDLDALAALIDSLAMRSPRLRVDVARSGHSVDVLPGGTTKVAAVRAVMAATDLSVLAIGDQGQVGGNDYELLAAVQYSLSVDRVSADPSRCWNLDAQGLSGPLLMHSYLRRLRSSKSGLRYEL